MLRSGGMIRLFLGTETPYALRRKARGDMLPDAEGVGNDSGVDIRKDGGHDENGGGPLSPGARKQGGAENAAIHVCSRRVTGWASVTERQ